VEGREAAITKAVQAAQRSLDQVSEALVGLVMVVVIIPISYRYVW
jgi:hypothetical protein